VVVSFTIKLIAMPAPTPQARRPNLSDPMVFAKVFWPHVKFYDKQIEIIRSVQENDETVVPAGNQLGKDFVSGFIALWYFLSHNEQVRVVTTSVADKHLDILWGEIGRFIATSAYPLVYEQSARPEEKGMLIFNHRMIRLVKKDVVDNYSYLVGMVAERPEKMTGHHAKHTLLIIDEASGVEDRFYDLALTWAKKVLIIGNCNNCANFFYRAVNGGDILAKPPTIREIA
jgi:phage terminase large subunit